eukprot:SAG22_NODE_22622_length_193_cov_44.734043_1_plen_28_part_10
MWQPAAVSAGDRERSTAIYIMLMVNLNF